MSRQTIITVDGDGSQRVEWVKRVHEIIQKHPTLKFTVSLITAYYDGTLHEETRKELTEAAETLFKEPNVEPASHTRTHPFDWVNPTNNILAKEWDVVDEVESSKKTMIEISGVTPRMFLLSGNCNPNGKQVEQIYRHGMTPFNGGVDDTNPFRLVDTYRVYNQRGYPDVKFHGVRKWKEGKAYLDAPDGYKNAVFWFKEHPERPIHIYIHFYAGEFPETIDAVNHVLDWCTEQETETLYLSEYIKQFI